MLDDRDEFEGKEVDPILAEAESSARMLGFAMIAFIAIGLLTIFFVL